MAIGTHRELLHDRTGTLDRCVLPCQHGRVALWVSRRLDQLESPYVKRREAGSFTIEGVVVVVFVSAYGRIWREVVKEPLSSQEQVCQLTSELLGDCAEVGHDE